MPLQEVSASNSRALQDIADAITKSHKILVVTGAGISTSCGIPDFRSKDGLYNLIPEQHIYPTPPSSEPSTPRRKRKASEMEDDELVSSQSSNSSYGSRRSSTSPASRMKGQDLFHSRVFQNSETTEVFYQFIASLRQKIIDDVKETSYTHKFIRTLRDGGRLMRCYTQNIDGLEAREGLCIDLTRGKGNKRRFMKKHVTSRRPDHTLGTDFDSGCEVVQLHGELTRLRCTVCAAEEEWTDEATQHLLDGYAPECEQCSTKSEIRQATGKRGLAIGGLRPNIVLYGEEHPQNTLLSPFVPYDVSSNPDVLLIMGTSLKVHGLQKIIRDFAKAVHSQKNGRVVFVNRTRPAESVWDGIIDDFVAMDCDDWVLDLRSRREDLWLRQGELNLTLKETKPAAQGMKSNKKRKVSVDILEDSEADKENAGISKQTMKSNTAGQTRLSIDIPPRKIPKVGGLKPKPGPKPRSAMAASKNGSCTPKRTFGKTSNLNLTNKMFTSPQRPALFSPITPPYSPLTPRSSSNTNSFYNNIGRKQSISNTPSKLRLASTSTGNICIDNEKIINGDLEHADRDGDETEEEEDDDDDDVRDKDKDKEKEKEKDSKSPPTSATAKSTMTMTRQDSFLERLISWIE